ncbi:MAG: bifunctional hydroxymethylpyrimidine kinase/phosphomethylpyrimidine kinase [Elusimicrobiota bacterium]|jgi:hydroxymethylpyrimidine/phosphomethylpyrimidine kinase|nr:bifunctional hydroxymethylpyrimidine kinase/phosphomethylpyrimidine kinase [Elusimicrobiota bacterium]
MKTVLTIAGSDSSGGAGIQADIKTITAHGLYASSVITALTAQNTTGVYGVMNVDAAFVTKQLECVFTDIFPDAVKIGMVSEIEIIEAIASALKKFKAANIVLDPVMVATSGGRLISEGAVNALKEKLFPLASLITPNIAEAEAITGLKIENKEDMPAAAKKFNKPVLLKGGHLKNCADDLFYDGKKARWFCAPKINNPNTHGTGCTLSSAVACNLAAGLPLETSIERAKQYITCALKAGLDLGAGSGPLNHCCKF